MSRERFELDPRLQSDTHVLGELPLARVLLVDDARFPWLILVPRRANASEVFDLTAEDYLALMQEVRAAAVAMELLFNPDKINVAALGNVVPQLHVHVVARFITDAAWPRPVFGAGAAEPYSDAALAQILRKVREALDLRPPLSVA
jgi:diadenosine tetraphosphate (Ap4A) HIT family hydrolase